jgi:hypothetical protein
MKPGEVPKATREQKKAEKFKSAGSRDEMDLPAGAALRLGVLECVREEQRASDGRRFRWFGLALVWVPARLLILSWNLPLSLRTAEESRSSEGVTMGPHHPMAPGAALAHLPNCRPITEMSALESQLLSANCAHPEKKTKNPTCYVCTRSFFIIF